MLAGTETPIRDEQEEAQGCEDESELAEEATLITEVSPDHLRRWTPGLLRRGGRQIPDLVRRFVSDNGEVEGLAGILSVHGR